MILDNETAREQYLKNGRLATLREYPYQKGKRVLLSSHRHTKRYGCALIKRVIVQPPYSTLSYYTKHSGFATTKEWMHTARKLNKGEMPDYLVIIERVNP